MKNTEETAAHQSEDKGCRGLLGPDWPPCHQRTAAIWLAAEPYRVVEALSHRMVAGVDQVDLGALHCYWALGGNLGRQGEGRIKHAHLVGEHPAADEGNPSWGRAGRPRWEKESRPRTSK